MHKLSKQIDRLVENVADHLLSGTFNDVVKDL